MKVCSKYPKELIHYNRQLQKRFFRKLRDNVWESKTKWQLLEKAKWTYHFKLITRCLRSWMTYTKYRIRKRRLLYDAEACYRRKIEYKSFSVIKRNVEHKWIQIKIIRCRLNLRKKRRIWDYWEMYVRKSLRAKEVESLTINMRELHLITSYLEIWFNRCGDKNIYKTEYMNAVWHHDHVLICKAFNVWRIYCARRNHNRDLIEHFSKHFELKLKGRILAALINYIMQKKLYKNHIQNVNLFYEKYLLKIVLDKWNTKFENLIESRYHEKKNSAVKLYNEKLISKSLKKLKIWALQQNLRKKTVESFVMGTKTVKIKSYLQLWQKSLQQRIFSKSLENLALDWRRIQLQKIFLTKIFNSLQIKLTENNKVEMFITYSNNNMMCRIFQHWRWFSQAKNIKRTRIVQAEYHYDIKLVKKAFWFLKQYVKRKIKKKGVVEDYERKLLRITFMKLKNLNEKRQLCRELIASCLEKRNGKILMRAFYAFKNNYMHIKYRWQTVSSNANSKLKRIVFQKWKAFNEEKRKCRLIWSQHSKKIQYFVIREFILIWKKNTQERLSFRDKLNEMRKNQERRIVAKYLKKWVGFIKKVKILMDSCLAFGHLHSKVVLTQYILKLKVHLDQLREIQAKTNCALMLDKRMIYKRCLKKWMMYVTWKKKKLKECSQKMICFRSTGIYPGSCLKSNRKQPMIPYYLTQEFM